ncbi:hypothetical protein Glove_23g168 [Diversispora epigaea]|uniref:Protein kinase domain-containing protein n=1 Tax=Diversispora epigaea TaxID=1348612 RepID=A0A397JL17_9GLOM|nr:hypothetical protein Glove_23g168 [Diversispora epigaea]
MSQENINEKESEAWMDNLIIEDTLQKENIPFYQYSEFKDIKSISGNVYKATFKTSQKTVALKCISLNDKLTLENLINEIKRHRKLEIHDSILRFYGITKQENNNSYMIILEYSNNGSLRQYLKTNFQKLDWNAKLNLAKQIADILSFLHSNDIIHGKLNSENILIHNGIIKFNVFGLTKIMPESLRFLINVLDPIEYIDPQYLEIFNTIDRNKSSDIFKNNNSYMIILEYSNNGSLRQYLKTNFQKLDWNAKLNLAKQIADILSFLHSNDIIHGKLNSENILIHNGIIKFNVFGLTKIMPESLRFLINVLDPIEYIDPQYLEIFNTIDRNKSSDIFSLGIILWEISSGTPPFEMESLSNRDLLNNIVKGKREMVIPGTPPKYKEIYSDCWDHNRNSRPSISQVVKNLSEIVITDEIVEFVTPQSQPHNVTDEIISVGLEKLNIQNIELEVHSDPHYVDKPSEVEVFIKNLFEFFNDVFKKQSQRIHTIMIKNYIIKRKMNPVEILYEMISHPSHSWFTSMIGFFYMNGIGTVTDDKMAFKFFSRAANDTSFSNSLSLIKLYNINKEFGTMFLADMHLNGLGGKKDTKKAFQIYSKLANEGSLTALTEVADCYLNGSGVEKNNEKAFELYLKSAEKGILAQYRVGLCYMEGIGTPKDEAKGFQWYLKAALAGNIDAMCTIAYCYNNGVGIAEDEKESFKWYLKAAEKGDPIAQYNLGNNYENGYGVNKSRVKSFERFKKAAEYNDIDGQYKVGKFFYEGFGTNKDIVKAIYWLNKATENGNIDSQKLLEKIINKIK